MSNHPRRARIQFLQSTAIAGRPKIPELPKQITPALFRSYPYWRWINVSICSSRPAYWKPSWHARKGLCQSAQTDFRPQRDSWQRCAQPQKTSRRMNTREPIDWVPPPLKIARGPVSVRNRCDLLSGPLPVPLPSQNSGPRMKRARW